MKFYKKTVRELPLGAKDTVLVRADYNVPLNKDGTIADDLRIRASLPTLEYLRKKHCKIVIMSHLGRPEGWDASVSLAPVAERLAELLKTPVQFVPDVIGFTAHEAIRRAPNGSVILLENLRFYPGEEADSTAFAKAIVKSVRPSFFVQDGFGVVHRAHASTHAITHFVPSVAGLLIEKEYEAIESVIKQPKRPLVAILGGAKVSDKIEVVERFVDIADTILVGGAMADTFLAYKGLGVGKSKVETDQKDVLDAIYAAARQKVGEAAVDSFIVLPSDVAVAGAIDPAAKREIRKSNAVRPDDIILDIGDESIETYTKIVENAQTVVWNGTLGYAELPEFAHGSARVALTLATHPTITSVVGGGDTADFVLKWDGHGGESFSHVSTGGGASLDLMAGKKLPGVETLLDAPRQVRYTN